MARKPELIKANTTQYIYFDAGMFRPSSTPSVGTKTSGGTEITASADTYVTLEPVEKTLASTASAGDYELTLNSVTNILVGSDYLVSNSKGQKEKVRVVEVDFTATSVTVGEPLEFDYASSNDFVSTRFYYTVQAADVATLGVDYTATATYAVGSLQRVEVQSYDVVLHPLRTLVTKEGIKKRWPDLSAQEFEEQKGEDYQRQIDLTQEIIAKHLRLAGRRPQLIVSYEDLEEWAYAEFARILIESGIKIYRNIDVESALPRIDSKCSMLKREALDNLNWYDADEDESKETSESRQPRPMFKR